MRPTQGTQPTQGPPCVSTQGQPCVSTQGQPCRNPPPPPTAPHHTHTHAHTHTHTSPLDLSARTRRRNNGPVLELDVQHNVRLGHVRDWHGVGVRGGVDTRARPGELGPPIRVTGPPACPYPHLARRTRTDRFVQGAHEGR